MENGGVSCSSDLRKNEYRWPKVALSKRAETDGLGTAAGLAACGWLDVPCEPWRPQKLVVDWMVETVSWRESCSFRPHLHLSELNSERAPIVSDLNGI